MKDRQKEKKTLQEFVIDGTTIAPGVAETIIAVAVSDVDGVANVGNSGPMSSLTAIYSGRLPKTSGIDLVIDDEKSVSVSFPIQIYYGYRLSDVAEKVRKAVVNSLKAQLSLNVNKIDIQIDGIQSKE